MNCGGRFLRNKITGRKILLAPGVDAMAIRDRLPDRNNWDYVIVEHGLIDLDAPTQEQLRQDKERFDYQIGRLSPLCKFRPVIRGLKLQ